MPARPGIKNVAQPKHPYPKWRSTDVGPADRHDIINVINMAATTRESNLAFVTHFMQSRHPANRLMKMIGTIVSEESEVSVSRRKVELRQMEKISLCGLELQLKNVHHVIFMYHVTEAVTNGETVGIMMPDHRVELTGLCRPMAFTQAINRMLTSAATPPSENCSSCIHYRRWQTEGNQGECTLEPPETNSDCPQQGNKHWCPQYYRRSQNAG